MSKKKTSIITVLDEAERMKAAKNEKALTGKNA